MGINELAIKAKELHDLRGMIEELQAEASSIEDTIKGHMEAQGAESLMAGGFKLTYKTITGSRLDTTAFKKAMPELAERFMKATSARRFTIA